MTNEMGLEFDNFQKMGCAADHGDTCFPCHAKGVWCEKAIKRKRNMTNEVRFEFETEKLLPTKQYKMVDDVISDVFGKFDQFELIDRGNLQAFAARVLERATPQPIDAWMIPLSSMSSVAQETFEKMMQIIKHGGQVDVVARRDGKDYRWECDGLKYAKKSSLPKPPETNNV